MKKTLYIVGGIFLFFILILVLVPIIFKDDIKAKIDSEIAKSVNAEVNFNTSDFSLSLLRNFPNATASLRNFSIVGKDEFKGDTLIAANSFRIVINIKSLFGDKISIKGIDVQSPRMLIKILEDGKANYDIMIGDEEEPIEETEPSEFSIGIDSWNIQNGFVVYDDREMKLYTIVDGLNHNGSGDFTQDIFDLSTQTTINALSVNFEDIEYLTNKRVEADIVLNMDLPKSKYTFKENTVRLNDFSFGFDGYFAMPGDDYEVGLNFAAKDNDFKSILSLVPGVFREGYEDIKAEGNVDFNGFVKGVYSESRNLMPAYNVNLMVDNAMFKYPDLPAAVTNINMNMLVDNKDGNTENTVIDISKFHMELGQNPVDAKLRVEGLGKPNILADVQATLNLADLTNMFPIEGTQLKGNFNLNLQANGVYDSAASRMPAVNANMALQNGFVKTTDFPSPLENVNFVSKVENKTGKMEDTEIWVNDYNMLLDGERLTARLYLKNLNDYTWDLAVNGIIDLEKMTKIYPLEDMQLSGRLNANIETKGKMSDVDAERYDRLPTSGVMNVQNFKYLSQDLPQGFAISNANLKFDPDRMVINSFDGAAGNTDIKLDGFVSNYIGYMFKDDQVLRGTMNFTSNRVDLNEWMTEDTSADTASTESLEIIEIPRNIDFVLNSSIREVLYTNMVLKDVKGRVKLKEGVASLENVNFNSLDGQFAINGVYDTRDLKQPTFNFDMTIRDLSVAKAYETFNTVQALAPIAEKVTGKFSTEFKINGQIGKDMMPVLPTLRGGGLIKIAQASLQDSKIIGGITSLTKLSDTDQVTMRDVIMQAEVKEGRLFVKPFDVSLGNYKTTIAGSNGLDGSLDYILKMDVPAGAAGAALNNALASISGTPATGSSNIKVNLKLGGTYNAPRFGITGSETGETIQQQAKAAAEDRIDKEVDKAKEEFDAKAKEAEERARQEVEERRKEAEEKARQEVERAADKTKDKAKEKARGILRGL
ncbi:hypothetical protein BH23BAC1_BH23BAC1_07850 [soil metagenome]